MAELQVDAEPDDAGADHDVPADLEELHEVLEYKAAEEQQ